MRELVVLRHGEGEGNARGIVQGRMDLPLTERGRGQARMAAELLRAHGWVPAHVVSSPQERCIGTATLVCDALGVGPPIADEAFVDLDVGHAEGRTMAELVREHPEVFARSAWQWRFDQVGGESRQQLLDRVAEGLARLPDREPVLLVSHGAVFKAVLNHLLGMSPDWLLDLRMCTVLRLRQKRTAGGRAWAFSELLHAEEWTGSVHGQ